MLIVERAVFGLLADGGHPLLALSVAGLLIGRVFTCLAQNSGQHDLLFEPLERRIERLIRPYLNLSQIVTPLPRAKFGGAKAKYYTRSQRMLLQIFSQKEGRRSMAAGPFFLWKFYVGMPYTAVFFSGSLSIARGILW
jgi:hypothetical protein